MRRKRAFDIVVVSLAAVAWVPVVILTAACVLLLSGRPVFYRSDRSVGPRRVINMVKFRVMVPDAHRIAVASSPDRFLNHPADSPLYTRTGRFLERWGLTELPQFFHVVSGSMSIVGSRPLTSAVDASLRARHPRVDDRYMTPAGLTGPPQLVGRDALTSDERLYLESSYCRAVATGYRFRLDFLILLYTVLIVLKIKRPMTYDEAIGLVHRHGRLVTERYLPMPPVRSEEVTLVAE